MAEEHLRGSGVPESQWPGMRFRWSENLESGMWASVVIEVERRGAQWIVVRIDRNRERIEDEGFRRVA